MISKNISNNPVGVIGAGSFGTTVANLLANNRDVLLYARRKEAVDTMLKDCISAGQKLADNVTPTHHLEEVAECCEIIFPVVPSEVFRAMMQQLAPFLRPYHTLIHGTKGFDVFQPTKTTKGAPFNLAREDVKTMSEVIREESVVVKVGCLSGPNLVKELVKAQPAATVVASQFEEVITQGQALLKSDRFQVYSSTDLIGVELCGALKNIIAIGAGCLSGLGYGENAKALLISRGIIEMIYIGKAMGASIKPFVGLAGIGDLVATCSSSSSRNHTVGYQLAQGKTLEQSIKNIGEVVEGINTIKIAKGLIEYYQMRAPITEMMYRVLFEGLSVQKAVHYLMKYPMNVDVDFL